MPPARSRVVTGAVVDDTRSEISSTTAQAKDRVVSSTAVSKTKKKPTNINAALHAPGSLGKGVSTTSGAAAHTNGTNAPGEVEAETPHIDWSTLPLEVLHNYRAAHRLQISSAYTRAHADLLYRSCPLALRAPSQVQARQKTLDLRAYRKRMAAVEAAKAAASTNVGVKPARKKQRLNRDSIQPQESTNAMTTGPIAQSIEPPSPRSNPSHATVSDHSTPSDQQQQQQQQQNQQTEELYTIPATLNQHDPNTTLTGFQPAASLATAIRKHSNARQISENETIARLTYIVRQHGSPITPRITPVMQRAHIQATAATAALLPSFRTLPTTALGSSLTHVSLLAAQHTHVHTQNIYPHTHAQMHMQTQAQPSTHATTKNNPSSAMNILTATTTLGGAHIHTEGSQGNGNGSIMGPHGRETKNSSASDGGGGSFRLRFRP